MGVITGMEALKHPCDVIIQTDSRYVIDGIEKGWAKSWKKRGWVKSDKKPAANSDLWERLLQLLEIHRVEFFWIKGHAGHPENERCDRLAVQRSREIKTGSGNELGESDIAFLHSTYEKHKENNK